MLDTLMMWLKRFRLPEPKPTVAPAIQSPRIEQPEASAIPEESRRFWYRKGREQGLRDHATVYICSSCQMQQQAEAIERAKHWQPEIERHTDPVMRAGDRLCFDYWRQQHQAGPQTEEHRAVHWIGDRKQ